MFDFHRNEEPSDEIYQVCIKPLKGYIDNKDFNEAYLALQNILVELIYKDNPLASSNSSSILEEEVEPLGWYGSSLFSILTDIKDFGDRIDLEKNIKCGAYAACNLYNKMFKQNIVLLYEKYAKRHSMV